MDKFVTHTGLVAPLDRANVDTDAIIPKQFLKSIKRTGYGPNCFDEWRYFDVGQPGVDGEWPALFREWWQKCRIAGRPEVRVAGDQRPRRRRGRVARWAR